MLKPGGVLLLRTPNIDSWEASVFRGNWYGLDAPRHFFLFSPGTMRVALEKAGFAVSGLRYQYHPVDCSRSLLYLCEDRGLPRMRSFTAGWIRQVEWGLTACTPLRKICGRGASFHVEARKASM